MSFLSRNRWTVVAICHYGALLLFSEINYHIAFSGIYILITGMLLTSSSLILSPTQGALSLIPIALYIDSRVPIPFGSSLIILIGLHFAIVLFRSQIQRETDGLAIATALFANLVIHLGYSLFSRVYIGTVSIDPMLISVNALCSSLVVALLYTLYSRTVVDILGIFGVNVNQEPRRKR